jgi:hypothetical protein
MVWLHSCTGLVLIYLLIIERRSMHGRMLFRQCGTKATQLIQVATCSFAVKLNLVRVQFTMPEFLGCKICL